MKLLLVEDDIFFQKFYSAKLVEAGFEVETAVDGNDGLAKIVSVHPDLILLDMIMPNKDGFEVLQSVSQNPELKKIPIIVFSTLGDENDVQRAMQLGAVDYINKSFHDIESLKAKINSHLSGAPVSQRPVTQQPQAQNPAQVTNNVQTPSASVQAPTQVQQPTTVAQQSSPVAAHPVVPPQQAAQTNTQTQPPVPPPGTPQKDGNTTGRT